MAAPDNRRRGRATLACHGGPAHSRDVTVQIRDICLSEARAIRLAVLRPLGPGSDVAYPGDASERARHFGAFADDTLVAVATFLPEPCPGPDATDPWRLRGMATLRSVRGRGVGGQLLRYGVERVLRLGATLIWCYGRTPARAFYERHGFRALGQEFALPHSGPHYLFILSAGPQVHTGGQRLTNCHD